MPTEIKSLQQFKELIEGDKVVVIDCWASWCGPCKMISPVFDKLEGQFSNVGFYKLDVEDQADVAQEIGIKAMPTFVFYKSGLEIGKVVGADPSKLQAALKLHSEA